jgi:hypothetical protein
MDSRGVSYTVENIPLITGVINYKKAQKIKKAKKYRKVQIYIPRLKKVDVKPDSEYRWFERKTGKNGWGNNKLTTNEPNVLPNSQP